MRLTSPTTASPRLLLGLLLAVLLAGCTDRKATGNVRGKVLFKDQLVTAGHVTFLGKDGRVASGEIRNDGTYAVLGAPVGPVTILVDSQPPPPIYLKEPPKSAAGIKLPGADAADEGVLAPRPGVGKYVPIPERFKKSDQSGLAYTVVKGEQTHDIVMQP